MKRRIRTGILLMLALLLAAGLSLAGEPAAQKETAEPLIPALELPTVEASTVVEIPLDQDSRKTSIPPKEECYLYEDDTGNPTGYADPSITVNIGRGRIYETNYIYARVRIASASQMRTLMQSTLTSKDTEYASTLAKRVNAVTAINGDWPGGDSATRRTKGALMRQGKLLRMKCDGKSDVLVVDRNGDFHILPDAKDEDVEALKEQAVNIFTFGPGLIINGEPNYGFRDSDIAPHKPAQRMANTC